MNRSFSSAPMATQSEPTQPSDRPPPIRSGMVRQPLSFADLAGYDCIIDTRSPAEYALDHIPGAISCPVLGDDERAQVGTLYKQTSRFDAKKLGATLVARNIAIHIETLFQNKPIKWRPLIYCWRGGARSAAMTHVFRQIGWDATQLEGGYKQWRASLVVDLDRLAASIHYIAVCGRTGSGKSRLLDVLCAKGAQVLDLERLAAHKGSVLGDLPDQPQPSQKRFESMIWATLSKFDSSQPVFVEAESKKIGVLRVPQALMTKMWFGACVDLATADPLRIPLLREEYAHLIANPALLSAKLDCLQDLHPKEKIASWHAMVQQGRWDDLVHDLLLAHYDPAYDKSMFRHYVNIGRAERIELDRIDPAGFAHAADAAIHYASKFLVSATSGPA